MVFILSFIFEAVNAFSHKYVEASGRSVNVAILDNSEYFVFMKI